MVSPWCWVGVPVLRRRRLEISALPWFRVSWRLFSDMH